MEVLIMITTESSKTNALRLAKLLVKNKLAACVSIKEIFSIYEWDNYLEKTKEFEITIKSKLEFKENLIDFLHKNSTYEVPQIIYQKYHTEMKYYDWLKKTI
jgi:periplasmic divalent cation tolerance protein